MPVDGREIALAPTENRALAVTIAASLRDAILAGRFGPGEQLREEPIARWMAVSKGPVREALRTRLNHVAGAEAKKALAGNPELGFSLPPEIEARLGELLGPL